MHQSDACECEPMWFRRPTTLTDDLPTVLGMREKTGGRDMVFVNKNKTRKITKISLIHRKTFLFWLWLWATMSKYKHYESFFNIKWCDDSKYKKWLKPSRESNEFYCTFCRKTLSLRGKGVSALNEHMKTKLHTDFESIKCRQTLKKTKERLASLKGLIEKAQGKTCSIWLIVLNQCMHVNSFYTDCFYSFDCLLWHTFCIFILFS